MSDEVPQPIPSERSAGGAPASPRVSLDKPTAPPTPAEPRDTAPAQLPVSDSAVGSGSDAGPVPGSPSGPATGPVPGPRSAPAADQRTLPSLPTAPPVSAGAGPAAASRPGPGPAFRPAPWAGPDAPAAPAVQAFAPPAGPFAPPLHPPPVNPFVPPTARQGGVEPVPPPPIAPDGPGQVPYGYPGGPSAYGYPGQGQQPAYAVPYPGPSGYGWPGLRPPPRDGLGTASLVLGILASIGFLLWPVALVLGILAVIFGAIGRGKARRGEATNPGVALAGLICGAVGIVLVLGLFAFVIALNP
ncbi:DUF4190 domain-containing protein [Streptomyces sp. NPDC040750]|uniref:DUF4190 domain-containing protein n=1 Tax=Streptomyces sp. NPDC040750 TaxID=3154491 RepID=UPI0033F861BF